MIFQFRYFVALLLGSCTFGYLCLLGKLTLLSFYNVLLSLYKDLVIYFDLNSTLFDINILTPAFF